MFENGKNKRSRSEACDTLCASAIADRPRAGQYRADGREGTNHTPPLGNVRCDVTANDSPRREMPNGARRTSPPERWREAGPTRGIESRRCRTSTPSCRCSRQDHRPPPPLRVLGYRGGDAGPPSRREEGVDVPRGGLQSWSPWRGIRPPSFCAK